MYRDQAAVEQSHTVRLVELPWPGARPSDSPNELSGGIKCQDGLSEEVKYCYRTVRHSCNTSDQAQRLHRIAAVPASNG